MIEIILLVGVVAFIIYAAFSIAYIINLKRTSNALREFLKNTENLNATLTELKTTLENVRKITANASAVTENVKDIAYTLASLQKGIESLYGVITKEVAGAAEANIAGLKAGIITGVATLVRNLQERRSEEHERGT